jgi:beta-glucosidase-like glycosyl hydrolase
MWPASSVLAKSPAWNIAPSGIQEALSLQVDLASEPRWSRITGTFGADPQLSSVLGGAYVQGFQGAPNGWPVMA